MMEGYAHPAANRQDDIWSMDNVMACKVYLAAYLRLTIFLREF
jgi:hypothetical protein